MGDVIKKLPFPVPAEKQEWLNTASQWRLPYWDWALRSTSGHVPGLFTMPSIAIRQPLDAVGATPTTLNVTNPLARYQLQTGSPKVPTAMGTLPPPYTVPDVVYNVKQGKLVLPVSDTHRCELFLIFFSGLSAQEPVDGASGMEWIKTNGGLASTTGWIAITPLMVTSVRTRELQSIARQSLIYVIESWPRDTPRTGKPLPQLEKTIQHCRIRTGRNISHLNTFIIACM